jgi:hypothetical protein
MTRAAHQVDAHPSIECSRLIDPPRSVQGQKPSPEKPVRVGWGAAHSNGQVHRAGETSDRPVTSWAERKRMNRWPIGARNGKQHTTHRVRRCQGKQPVACCTCRSCLFIGKKNEEEVADHSAEASEPGRLAPLTVSLT